MSEQRIAVVGAGVVGLSTATELQRKLPDAEVDLIADKFTTETCSDGAAGLFRPGVNFRGATLQISKRWLLNSYKYYNTLLTDSPREAKEAGIIRIGGYLMATESPKVARNFFLEELTSDFRSLSNTEVKSVNKDLKFGSYCTTLLTCCRKYLPFLEKKFLSNGGTIIPKRLETFEYLCDKYDLLFNCSGLGAQILCNDNTVTAIAGQVFKVKAPWIKNFYYSDYSTYAIPDGDTVTLGGCRLFDCFDTKVNKYMSADIWDRCTNFLPSLKDAEIIREWVGLRPYRPTVRVEKEIMEFSNGKSIKVVHNYGHGGYGVMSAPGTSQHAVHLGLEFINQKHTSKL